MTTMREAYELEVVRAAREATMDSPTERKVKLPSGEEFIFAYGRLIEYTDHEHFREEFTTHGKETSRRLSAI